MVYVGMIDGFIVLDADTMNKSHTKSPEIIKGNHSKVPQLITGSLPKLPAEEVITSVQKLTENPIKPTTIKLPELAFVSPPSSPSEHPYYPYGPHPYLFQTVGYGYNHPSYVYQTSYGTRPYAPQSGFGFNPYEMSKYDNSNGFRPNPSFSRPNYGFRPYVGDVNQDALLQYSSIE
jgi:hypothetical protein